MPQLNMSGPWPPNYLWQTQRVSQGIMGGLWPPKNLQLAHMVNQRVIAGPKVQKTDCKNKT